MGQIFMKFGGWVHLKLCYNSANVAAPAATAAAITPNFVTRLSVLGYIFAYISKLA